MQSPESRVSVQTEKNKPKKEMIPQPIKVEKEEAISGEQLMEFAAGASRQVEKKAAEILSGAEQRIETSVKSMHVSSETIQAVRQEQGLEEQLNGIQGEANRLAREAATEIENATREDIPLQDRVKLRQERAKGVVEKITFLRKNSPGDFIEKFNSTVSPEQIRGLEFTIIPSKGDKLLIIDASGKLNEITCTDKNAADVLKSVKDSDETLRGNSHELRSEIVKRSKGGIKTHEAYTYGQVGSLNGTELKDFLDNEANWTEERQLLHQEIAANELNKAAALSERLEDEEPTIYALRGNTAAGKTTRVKNDPTFKKAIDTKGEPSGAINPDIYKEQLKSAEKIFGREQVTHFQSHSEGSALARRIKAAISESDSSMIIDQRLNEANDITELIKEADRTGKKLKFLDVDSPMELSLVRVLARKPGGADPLPPFKAVAEGYEGVRKNRQALIEAVSSNDAIDSYVLYGSDENGQSVKVAEKVNGELKVLQGQADLYMKAKDGNTESTVQQLRTQVIDDAYIARAKDELKLPEFQIKALEKYRGRTFEAALAEHSKQIDAEAPSFETYTTAALTNLENTSRTAKGKIDTSASPDKAQKMQEGLTSESAAELAKSNFQEALGNAYKNKDRDFESPEEIRQFVESIAQTINQGITKEGVLIRQGADSPKYPYARVADLEARMTQFYEEFQKRLENPKEDPKALAAWVEYKIDLADHFFADGCGKTAKLVSAWVMMRADKELPDYTMHGKIPSDKARSEYYANAPKTIPGTDSAQEAEELQRWTNYYQKL